MSISAVLWSMATMAAGYSRSYFQLITARSAVGIGEAGFGTMAPSFAAEWFPHEKRARILSFFNMAIPVGSALGYILGGYLGQRYGWRNAFMMVGIPGAVMGATLYFLKEPREHSENTAPAPSLSGYKPLLLNKTYLLTSFAQAAATFSVGGLAAWMPTYFVRYFGFEIGKAGMVFGGITVIAGICGNLSGGFLADFFAKKTGRAYFLVAFFSFLAAIPCAIACLMSAQIHIALIMLFFAEVFVFMHTGPLYAAIIDTVPLNMRSMAFALNIFIIHAFGDAVSPVLIGMLSDMRGLKTAVFACILVLIVAAGFSWAAGRMAATEAKEATEAI